MTYRTMTTEDRLTAASIIFVGLAMAVLVVIWSVKTAPPAELPSQARIYLLAEDELCVDARGDGDPSTPLVVDVWRCDPDTRARLEPVTR